MLGQVDAPTEEGESPRKRNREVRIPGSQDPDGSTEGLPPGTDEAGMRVDQSQEAPGAPHQPKPTVPEARGEKRRSDGDDEDREFAREDDLPAPNAASGSKDEPMDYLSHRDRQHHSEEKVALAALKSEGRTRDMDVVRRKLDCESDVAKVYSPPRTVTVAQAAGLRGGSSLDLTAPDPDGHVWDFSIQANRVLARKMLDEHRP